MGHQASDRHVFGQERGGGQSGIRTLEGLAPLPVFKTGAFNHSANCPLGDSPLAM